MLLVYPQLSSCDYTYRTSYDEESIEGGLQQFLQDASNETVFGFDLKWVNDVHPLFFKLEPKVQELPQALLLHE